MDVHRDHDQDKKPPRGLTRASALFLAFILPLTALPPSAAAGEAARPQHVSLALESSGDLFPTHVPVYRILLRVHLNESNRRPEAFAPILEEINEIWLSQAGICFEMQTVLDDRSAEHGWDVWFVPDLPESDLNGYYRSDHDIRVRDTPDLAPVEHPARHPAARTAAHELGHGLSLVHRQDSDENLMRSKTFGWRLNAGEVEEARRTAEKKALTDTAPMRCGENPGP